MFSPKKSDKFHAEMFPICNRLGKGVTVPRQLTEEAKENASWEKGADLDRQWPAGRVHAGG